MTLQFKYLFYEVNSLKKIILSFPLYVNIKKQIAINFIFPLVLKLNIYFGKETITLLNSHLYKDDSFKTSSYSFTIDFISPQRLAP